MRISILSDLHGYIPPDLPEGDLLIVNGDLTASDQEHQYFEVFDWIDRQPFRKKILVAGNHDMRMEKENYDGPNHGEFTYLCCEQTEFEGLKIWGSPLSAWFKGINPACTAFTASEAELEVMYAKIPHDIDILISHGPAYGILDLTRRRQTVGSPSLLAEIDRIKPKLFVSGHIHEGYGTLLYKHAGPNTFCVNASIMDRDYEPVNKPITVILEGNQCRLSTTPK